MAVEHLDFSSRTTSNRDLTPTSFSEFLLAMVAGLFAYGGWHMVTYTAGETVMPARTIPTALLVGVGIVTACYIALNVAVSRGRCLSTPCEPPHE